MKPLSSDLRERVYQAYLNRTGTVNEVAARFSVSASFIYKIVHRQQVLGNVDQLPHAGGHPRAIPDNCHALLLQWIAEQPDATLEELVSRLKEKRQGKRI